MELIDYKAGGKSIGKDPKDCVPYSSWGFLQRLQTVTNNSGSSDDERKERRYDCKICNKNI